MRITLKENRIRDWACALAGALLIVTFLCTGCVTVSDSDEEDPILTRDSHMGRFHYEMAEKFWKQGNEDLAVKYLRKAVKADPLSLEARLGLIDIWVGNDRLTEARTYISITPEELKYEPELLDRMVFILEIQEDYEALAQTVTEASEQGVDQDRFLTVRAEARVLRKDYDGARELFESAWAADPEDASVLQALVRIYRLTGSSLEEAEALLRLTALCPDDPQYPHEAALLYDKLELREDGIQGLEPLYTVDDGRIRGEVCLALAFLYFNEEQWCEAVGMFTLAQDKGDCFLRTEDRKRLAEAYLRCGDNRNAAAELQALLADNPDDSVVRAALALAFWRDGQDTRAEEAVTGAPQDDERGNVLNALEKRLKTRGGKAVD